MRKFIFIKILSFWAVLLCLVISFINQSNGEEIMFSSKRIKQELRQAVIDIGHRFEWRTLAGRVVVNFPEGKVLREIEDLGAGFTSSLSPDATKIAFFQPRSNSIIEALVKPLDLMLEDINAGMRQPLGLIALSPASLAWSPDGKKLALIAEDVSTDIQVTWPEEPFFGPSRPRKLFIFSIPDKSLDEFDIIRSGGIALCSDQIWSPKGDEILYTVWHNERPPFDTEIRILSLVTKITRSLGRGSFPTWSPISNQIVFCGADNNYYLINADGSGKTLLLKSNSENLHDLGWPFLWSPDGRWLLVVRSSYNDTVDLFVMDLESKVMVKIESQTGLRTSWKGKHENSGVRP